MADSDNESKSYKTLQLKGSDNYADWELSIATTLMGKDLLDVIHQPRPSPSVDNAPTIKKHAKAFALIIQSLSTVIQSSLSPAARSITAPDAHILWSELKKKYSASVGSRQAALLHDIWTTKVADIEDPAPILSKIQSAHAQLNNGGENLSDRMLAFAMTMALPESYSTLQQTMWMQEDLNSATVAGAVQAEWARRQANNSTALYARTNNNNKGTKQNRPNNQNNRNNKMFCSFHNSRSHNTVDCRNKPNPTANIATNESENTTNTTNDLVVANLANLSVDAHAFNVSLYKPGRSTFVIDSGASHHMVCDPQLLSNVQNISTKLVTLGDGKTTPCNQIGTLKLGRLIFQGVLLVPGLDRNLLSVSKTDLGKWEFGRTSAQLTLPSTNEILISAPLQNGLYSIQAQLACYKVELQGSELLQNWHERLGHCNIRSLLQIKERIGLQVSKTDLDNFECEACILGKGKRLPAPESAIRATQPLATVHIDLWGPATVSSLGGCKYFLTCYDDFTRKITLTFLKSKSEAFVALQNYIARVENQLDCKVKAIRSDNGGEFTSNAFKQFLQQKGIEHQLVPPAAHAQNGRVERAHLTIMDGVRTLLAQSKLEPRFWAEAAHYIAYSRNRTPSGPKQELPDDLWYKRESRLDHLQPFASKLYFRDHTLPNKLSNRYKSGFLMGYMEGTHNYRVWDGQKIIITRDVVFAKQVVAKFTTKSSFVAPEITTKSLQNHKIATNTLGFEDTVDPISQDERAQDLLQNGSNNGNPPPPSRAITFLQNLVKDRKLKNQNALLEERNRNIATTPDPIDAIPGPDERTQRQLHAQTGQSILHTMDQEGSGSESKKSLQNSESDAESSSSDDPLDIISDSEDEISAHLAYYHALSVNAPSSYQQARTSSEWGNWKSAISAELAKMDKYKVWEVIPRTDNMRVVGARWVFTRKIDGTTGKPSAYKARWVAKGYSQIEGVDFTELFAGVARKDSIRLFLALVNYYNLECDQVDIVAAFLNGDLEETIYMDPPEGSTIPQGSVIRLLKSLYGLKQSPRCFNKRFDSWLKDQGFRPTMADPCLYFRKQGETVILISIHVDDQLIASNNRPELDRFKKQLNSEFECSDSGPASYFLGFNIIRDRKNCTLSISQQHYFEALLEKFNMLDCNPTQSPLPTTFKPVPATDTEFDEARSLPYAQLVGAILYASTVSRPDLSHAASVLSRYISKWSKNHFSAAKHLLRYIKGTTDYALTFKAVKQTVGYCDADWGGDLDTRRSTTGYLFKIFGGVVSWRSRRQPTVALSTTEAEYMASADAARQAIWLRQLLEDLQLGLGQDPFPIYNDNAGTVALSKNPVYHERSKHIGLRHHYLRERVEDGTISLLHIPSVNNIADLFTKPLPRDQFNKLRNLLGVIPLPDRVGVSE
jgi:transposase InsO family protein